MMFAFLGSPVDMMIVVAVALVVFGPKRLPEVARQLGSFVREARSMLSHVTDQFEGFGNDVRSAGSGGSDNVMRPTPGVNNPPIVPYDQRDAYKPPPLRQSESIAPAEAMVDAGPPSLRLTHVADLPESVSHGEAASADEIRLGHEERRVADVVRSHEAS